MRKLAGLVSSLLVVATAGAGCTAPGGDGGADSNPFLDDQANAGKEDTGYLNPDGVEVEVDLEGDVAGPASRLTEAPAQLGQFAMTYFRKSEKLFIESIAEVNTADTRAEWLVNGTWYPSNRIPTGAMLKHWRLKGMNAVLLTASGVPAKVGNTLTAPVPAKPFSIYSDAGTKCADGEDHISLDQSVYWYRWEPDQAGCIVEKQNLKITISKTFSATSAAPAVYPEYDQLVADGKVTAVIMFGQIDDGPITASESGMQSFKRYGAWLTGAGFAKVTAPLGERYAKTVHGTRVEIDLYSPREFSGLGDYGHFANFQKAITDHEIVVWDGHSMLGASDFWSRPTYPSTYQIFLYGGCLGYEYYVQPILAGKGGTWDKLDIMSSVVEVSATASEFAGPAIAKLVWALDHNYKASWRQILTQVRTNVGDSTFGVSGVRANKFHP